jgi:hypothetical protein
VPSVANHGGGRVDPHGGGLGACYADGGAIVIEVRASTLFVCLGGWVEDAHAWRWDSLYSRRRKSPLIRP